MDVYVKANPGRLSEMIQYEHIIGTIAYQFTWDNVYSYDKDFRLHMAQHPVWSWALILHQAWALRLRDKIKAGEDSGMAQSQGRTPNRGKNDYCKRFNKTGKCSFGKGCKFEHRCMYCHKFGHPIIKCRVLQSEQQGEKADRWGNCTAKDLLSNLNVSNNNAHNKSVKKQ